MNSALLITDVTNCFGPNGELPVPATEKRARETVSKINKLIYLSGSQYKVKLIMLSRDWHDPNSPHFIKWPVHGVKFSNGSKFYPGLEIRSNYIPVAFISKGLGKADGYSPFDPLPHVNIILVMPDGNAYPWEGDADSLCKHFEVQRIFNMGWARNYCVEAGCMAGKKLGYDMRLVTDASDGVNVPTDPDNFILKSDERMLGAGIKFQTSDMVEYLLTR